MSVLLPAFALFALTIFVLVRMGLGRRAAVQSGEFDGRYYKTFRGGEEPDHLHILSRQFSNLLEVPMLFYVGVLLAYVTGQTGWLPTAIAWLYVALRYAHCYVHLTSNFVPMRFRLFVLSVAALVTLWAVLFAGIVLR